MAVMKFNQLTVGARFTVTFQVISFDPENGEMHINVLDANDDVSGDMTFSDVSTGDFSGHIISLTATDVNAITQNFARGDIVRAIDNSGMTHIVQHMSEDGVSANVGDNTDGEAWITSGAHVRVGHIEPDSIGLPA